VCLWHALEFGVGGLRKFGWMDIFNKNHEFFECQLLDWSGLFYCVVHWYVSVSLLRLILFS
jgi:hypothetical protein